MVDGKVCVQCMMGDVVYGWCAVVVSGNQIHDTDIDLSSGSWIVILFQLKFITFTFSHLADAFIQLLTNEDNRSKQL